MMNPHTPLFRAAFSILALAVSAAAQSLYSQGQTLLSQGDPIPGLAGATNGGSSSLDFPVVDLSGNVLFRGRFTGGGVTTNIDDRAYFLGRTNGDLQMLIRSGDPEPTGTLGAGVVLITQSSATLQLGGLGSSPRISPEGGYILFGSGMTGGTLITTGTAATGRNDSALFVRGPGGVYQILAQRGTQAFMTPSFPPTLFDTAFAGVSYQTTSLNSSGTAAFQATLAGGDVVGTTNNFANFVGQAGQPPLIVMRKGQLVPVDINGNTCEVGFVGFNLILNAAGMVLHDERFNATGGTTPATTANDSVLMIWQSGNNTIIMREGDAAPVATGSALYGSPSLVQGFGASGGCAFGTTMTGGTVTPDDNTALFVGGLGGFQQLVREGDAAPGLTGVAFATPNFNASYSDFEGGSVAFYATLRDQVTGSGVVTTSNDQSIWLGSLANKVLVAREGDPAPGFSSVPGFVSATFGQIQAGSVQLNARGQMVFSNADVTLVTASGTSTLACNYSWDPVKKLQLLLAPGDNIQTGVGLVPANNTGGVQFPSSDGCPLGLSNQGDVLQRVNFNTGGAIVRAHIGSNNCSPSMISTATGGSQTMQLDAGVANANQLYLVACSGSGSRPGFVFGGAQIDLNVDAWTNLALSLANSTVWTNTLGLLDPTGKAVASFNLPPAVGSLSGTDLRHALLVIDFNTLNVLFSGEPCGVLLD
ncbi:MAG: hypothetical protein MUC36_23120 [Planctomycetes bacterium]|jgi:hypothetical protein|nr:hypothetical protein [Planctomycetota bacterium]